VRWLGRIRQRPGWLQNGVIQPVCSVSASCIEAAYLESRGWTFGHLHYSTVQGRFDNGGRCWASRVPHRPGFGHAVLVSRTAEHHQHHQHLPPPFWSCVSGRPSTSPTASHEPSTLVLSACSSWPLATLHNNAAAKTESSERAFLWLAPVPWSSWISIPTRRLHLPECE
jgi:hypothetical protein